jgi:hypothetical protein
MYRANFTGKTVNNTLAKMPVTPDIVNQWINNGDAFGAVPQKLTDPITVSSTTNDAIAILAIIIVVAVVGVLATRMRKKK